MMKRISALVLLQLLVACTVVSPLSDELTVSSEVPLEPARLVAFTTSDGFELAYRAYVPEAKPAAALLFYHGGVYGGADYQTLGHRLQQMGVATYMPDILGDGHGESEGGDAPEPERVLRNAKAFVAFVRTQHPDTAIAVGGHSSGVGLMLNVLDTMPKPLPLDGIVMIAPDFGHPADSKNEPNPTPVVDPDFRSFPSDGVSDDWFEDEPAVGFNYPDIVRGGDPKLFEGKASAMWKTVTPEEPRKALADIDVPIGIWLGEGDVEFDTAKVVQFVLDANPNAKLTVVEGVGDLTSMAETGQTVGNWLTALKP
ncbi:alpha/beta hydrolase [Allohahella sp. A8]|uniref:alpha/beta hydrolase n=1 Tax=Allohahella sp. A8 TaxID=3141461 RepID=UPI003A804BE9